MPLQEISQADYPRRMYLKSLPISTLIVWFLLGASVGAQDNPMDDPDLQQLLKQAQEMQKNSGSPDTQKKLANMEAMAKQEAAQQEQEEKPRKGRIAGRAQETARGTGSCRVPRLDAGHTGVQTRR